MTAKQKLNRVLLKVLYELADNGTIHEDEILTAYSKCFNAAEKYHKDVINEEAEAARKRHREWRSKHMQEHPECWTLVTESMGALGDNTEFVPFVPEKWPETK